MEFDYLKLLKALHLMAALLWVGALYALYLSLMVHVRAGFNRTMAAYETRLYRGVANPMMMTAILLGAGMLVIAPHFLKQPWIHTKLLLVVFVLGLHLYGKSRMRRFYKSGSMDASQYILLMSGLVALTMMIIFLAVFRDPIPWVIVAGIPLALFVAGVAIAKIFVPKSKT